MYIQVADHIDKIYFSSLTSRLLMFHSSVGVRKHYVDAYLTISTFQITLVYLLAYSMV